MNQQPSGDLHIYDPNLNPYGLELACLLSGSGFEVHWWTMRDSDREPAPDVVKHPKLAGTASSSPLTRIAHRVWQPLAFATAAGRHPALVCWVRDPWDALVFGLRARLGLPTVVVYHNPRQVRPRGGLAGKAELWLLRKATVVVHSEWLRSLATTDFPHAVVAPHPPYAFTVRRVSLPTPLQPEARVFCFVGALRADKGRQNLVALAQQTSRPWRLRIIGPDRLDGESESAIRAAGVSLEYTEPQPPSDEDLIREMATSSAMLAPYTAPTASGSAHLAVTLGLPVLGLTSHSFDGLVPERDQAEDISGLARLLDLFETAPTRPLPNSTAPDAAAAKAWREAILSA